MRIVQTPARPSFLAKAFDLLDFVSQSCSEDSSIEASVKNHSGGSVAFRDMGGFFFFNPGVGE